MFHGKALIGKNEIQAVSRLTDIFLYLDSSCLSFSLSGYNAFGTFNFRQCLANVSTFLETGRSGQGFLFVDFFIEIDLLNVPYIALI